MTTLLTLLVFGSVWFYALVLVTSILLIICLEVESGKAASFLTVAVLLAYVLLGGHKDIAQWVTANPLTLGLYGVGYIIIGPIWGVIKWWLYLLKRAEIYESEKMRWLRKYAKTREGTEYRSEEMLRTGQLFGPTRTAWRDYLADNQYGTVNERTNRPSAAKCKGLIIFWMTYWPWSALWTLINDPIRRTFQFVYKRLSTTLDRIANQIYENIDPELNDEE